MFGLGAIISLSTQGFVEENQDLGRGQELNGFGFVGGRRMTGEGGGRELRLAGLDIC
jgi:hypothetical protein